MKRDDISHSHLSTGGKKSSPAESSIFINTFPPILCSYLSRLSSMFDVNLFFKFFIIQM